jgi:fluoroquinolone resistance protein
MPTTKTKKLVVMRTPEFIRKVISGERDFSNLNLKLDELYNHKKFGDLVDYLNNQKNLMKNNLIFNNSYLWACKLCGLNLPGTEANNSTFEYAHFESTNLDSSKFKGSTFYYANFTEAILRLSNFSDSDISFAVFNGATVSYVDFSNSNLLHAVFKEADIRYTKFHNSDLRSVNFSNAKLCNTELAEAMNLEYSVALENAFFRDTVVNEEQRKMIEEKLKSVKLFASYKKN